MAGSSLNRLDIFSPACAVGCPLGNSPVATLGQITAVDKEVEGENFWMINAPTYFGNSGGGVYSVPDCNLIGIFSMIYTYGKAKPMVVPHMGLFLPLDSIAKWLGSEELGFVFEGEAVPPTAWKEMGYSPRN
jgi:S1-C subfamily serine protease